MSVFIFHCGYNIIKIKMQRFVYYIYNITKCNKSISTIGAAVVLSKCLCKRTEVDGLSSNKSRPFSYNCIFNEDCNLKSFRGNKKKLKLI